MICMSALIPEFGKAPDRKSSGSWMRYAVKEAVMSIVIVGGHDRMVCQYKKICKNFHCKAKVFTQMSAGFGKQIGTPDLLVLFTSTVSHKMVKCALDEAKRGNVEVVRCHTSSGCALSEILEKKCGTCQ